MDVITPGSPDWFHFPCTIDYFMLLECVRPQKGHSPGAISRVRPVARRLDSALAEMAQRAGYLDKEMSAVKGRIDQGFAAQAARFEQDVTVLSGTVEEGLAGAAAKVDGLAAGVSGLTGQVDLIGGQAQVAHGRLERLEETVLTLAEALLRPSRRLPDQRRDNGRG
jgi:hypothetical protein